MTQLEWGWGSGEGNNFLLLSFHRHFKIKNILAIGNTCFNGFRSPVALQVTPPTTCHLKLSVRQRWLQRASRDCTLPLGKRTQQKAYANVAGFFLLGLVAFKLMHPGLVSREMQQQPQIYLAGHLSTCLHKPRGSGDVWVPLFTLGGCSLLKK